MSDCRQERQQAIRRHSAWLIWAGLCLRTQKRNARLPGYGSSGAPLPLLSCPCRFGRKSEGTYHKDSREAERYEDGGNEHAGVVDLLVDLPVLR